MAKIHTDLRSVRASNSRSALGQIWLDVGGQPFPCLAWDDFVVYVLEWWSGGIEQILQGEAGPVIFAFMDGPYEFAISRSADEFKIRLYVLGDEQDSSIDCSLDIKEFLNSYCDVVKAVVNAIEGRLDWRQEYFGSVESVDYLKNYVCRLERLLMQ